jgi:cytoskeleton protein RodZ
MDSVGELLRAERLRQGLELAQIAEQLRINLSYLAAIEEGDTASLPGAFFYRAFVRQYARLLGLNEEAVEPALSLLRKQAEAEQPLPSLQPPPPPYDVPPMPPRWRRPVGPRPSSIILLVAVIVACSGIYALWQRARRPGPAAPPPQASVPAPASPPQPALQTPPAAPPSSEPAAPAAAPSSEPAARAESVPARAPVTAAPAPEPAPADARLLVEVAATDMVWLSATVDGRKIVTVLQAGQTRRFAANERASLFLGNAGGLEIRVNGKSIGPVGPRGQLRTVAITPEGFTITNPREKKEEPNPP